MPSSYRARARRAASPFLLGLAVAAALAGLAPARRGPLLAAQPTPDPTALTGRDWARLAPAARQAYLSGFLAGAASQQALAASPRATGPQAAARAAALRRRGALTFAFRENVYRSHLDDYFFYENRRRETLIAVLVEVNASRTHGQ